MYLNKNLKILIFGICQRNNEWILYRNTAFDEKYYENSFIGKILDFNVLSDTEYLKLENNLLKILKNYQNK